MRKLELRELELTPNRPKNLQTLTVYMILTKDLLVTHSLV
jgi:hypothetical protein